MSGSMQEEQAVRVHISSGLLKYDGSQLRSHFALRTFGVPGDSIVCFQGGMDIPAENVADLEDRLQGKAIAGSRLLHAIVEHFGIALEVAVLRQRLLMRLAADLIRSLSGAEVTVAGDDLFVGEGKLSVSVAAPSPVSCLIHAGINISTAGVPVRAASLEELKVDPEFLAPRLAESYCRELESIRAAACKVRGVR